MVSNLPETADCEVAQPRILLRSWPRYPSTAAVAPADTNSELALRVITNKRDMRSLFQAETLNIHSKLREMGSSQYYRPVSTSPTVYSESRRRCTKMAN